MTLYKALDPDGTTIQRWAKWHLPEGGQPGAWMPRLEGKVKICGNGYHLATERKLLFWFGPRIFEAEHRGDKRWGYGKVAVREARLIRECTGWNSHSAVLFAADCAERVLPLFAAQRPGDGRPRKAIAAAREPANRQGYDAARLEGWAGALTAAAEAAGMTDAALAESLVAALKQAGDRHFVAKKHIGKPGAGPRMTCIRYGHGQALSVAEEVAKKHAPDNPAWAAALAAASACNLKCAFRAALWASAWAQVAVKARPRSRSGMRAFFGSIRQSYAEVSIECWQNEPLLHYVKGGHDEPDPCLAREPDLPAKAETANVVPFVPRRETSNVSRARAA